VFDRLASRFGRSRIVAAAIVAIGVLSDTWLTAMPLADTPRPFRALDCDRESRGPVVELPLGYTYPDVSAMYRQMSHHRPVVNGYSGYFPPHYAALRFGLMLRDPEVLNELAAHGVTTLIVDREPEPNGHWDKYVLSNPNARLVCTEGQQTLFRLTAPPARTARDAGQQLPPAVIRANVNEEAIMSMIDHDRRTRWESGPQSDRTIVDIDLGSVRTVTGIDTLLGPFVEDFPRGLSITASQDGQTWTEIWQGSSAGLAFSAAFESPLEVPLRYRFAPTPARMLRMRSTKNDDTYYWSIAELRVLGP